MTDDDKAVDTNAIPTGKADAVDVITEKQGGKYCGCFCDYRRAILIFSILAIIIDILYLITGLTMVAAGDTAGLDQFDELSYGKEVRPTLTLIMCGVGVVMACTSFFGALKYNVPCLSVNIAWLMIQFGVVTWATISDRADIYNAGEKASTIISLGLFVALAIYPLAFLIKEINAGIMSESTYPREAYSCCCSPKV